MDWHRVAGDFEPDGSLRDIYVPGTSLDDWQRVLDALQERWPLLDYTLDGEAAPLPGRAEDIFDARRERTVKLSFVVADARVFCHFFVEEEIEFDIDPREVTQPEQVDALTDFMATLGRVTAKPVLLTMESSPEAVIFRYSPESDEVIWVEPHFVTGRGGW